MIKIIRITQNIINK